MELIVLGSNSSGNCYLLENDREALLIECGVSAAAIKQAINFNIQKLQGCLVTHGHGDHRKSAGHIVNMGVCLVASRGTHEEMGTLSHHRAVQVCAGKEVTLGGFRVMSFDVIHDTKEPVGFMIHHEETGNILFLTDTKYSPNRYRNLHNIIVECNYSLPIMKENIRNGHLIEFVANRTMKSHMSLETVTELLNSNDLTAVNNIVLIHLSDKNSDAVQFKSHVAGMTGKSVHIARPGLKIPFNKTPFCAV